MALQLAPGNTGYATATDAYRDLRKLPSPPESSGLGLLQAIDVRPGVAGSLQSSNEGDALEDDLFVTNTPPLLPAAVQPPRSRWPAGVPVWMAIVLTAIAVSEAALGLMLWRSSGGVSLLAADSSETRTGPAGVGATPAALTSEARRSDIDLPRPRRAVPRSGGLRLLSPIDLHVLEGDRLLGTTSGGTIVASVGTHDFELVNTALGIHLRQTVTFRPGQITQLSLEIPRGRISVNADPWAEVLIDNESIGETPLANVGVTLGEHTIVFRHPEYGERHESVVVRADVDAYVNATFEQ
jgi:hypothetical protein